MTKTTLKVKSNIKSAGFGFNNHNRKVSGLKVKTNLKAAGLGFNNHNRSVAG